MDFTPDRESVADIGTPHFSDQLEGTFGVTVLFAPISYRLSGIEQDFLSDI
jgi:hypothetical protein